GPRCTPQKIDSATDPPGVAMRETRKALQDVAMVLQRAGWDQAAEVSPVLPQEVRPVGAHAVTKTPAGQEDTNGIQTSGLPGTPTETRRALEDVLRILRQAGWDRGAVAVFDGQPKPGSGEVMVFTPKP